MLCQKRKGGGVEAEGGRGEREVEVADRERDIVYVCERERDGREIEGRERGERAKEREREKKEREKREKEKRERKERKRKTMHVLVFHSHHIRNRHSQGKEERGTCEPRATSCEARHRGASDTQQARYIVG